MREAFLTTSDNPFDPREDFNNWYNFDTQKGYNSSEYLSRIARTSDSLSDNENARIIEQAIDDIVALNLIGKYKKVLYEDGKRIL